MLFGFDFVVSAWTHTLTARVCEGLCKCTGVIKIIPFIVHVLMVFLRTIIMQVHRKSVPYIYLPSLYTSGPKSANSRFAHVYTLHGVLVTVINRRRHGRRRVRARLAAKVHRFTRFRPTGDDRAAVTHCCALRCCSPFTRVRSCSKIVFVFKNTTPPPPYRVWFLRPSPYRGTLSIEQLRVQDRHSIFNER